MPDNLLPDEAALRDAWSAYNVTVVGNIIPLSMIPTMLERISALREKVAELELARDTAALQSLCVKTGDCGHTYIGGMGCPFCERDSLSADLALALGEVERCWAALKVMEDEGHAINTDRSLPVAALLAAHRKEKAND